MIGLRNIARGVLLLLIVALVGVFVIYAVPGTVGADHSYVVLSGSMQPDIGPGDVVIVSEVPPETIEDQDVISFVRGGESAPTTHRVENVVEGREELAFETKGDANEDADPDLVPAENVIGKVTLTIPYIGHVVRFANTTLGFVTLLGIPLGLLVGTEVWSLVSHQRSREASRGSESGDEKAEPATEEKSVEAATDGDRTNGSNVAGTGSLEEPDTVAAGDDEELTVTLADLRATSLVLLLVTPYAIYVAIQMRTALTISVGFASGFALLAVGALQIAARFPATAPAEHQEQAEDALDEEVTTDGGTQAEAPEGGSS